MESIKSIDPSNKSLEYVEFRISNVEYRGGPSSEHNRYSFDKVIDIFTLLQKYAPKGFLMQIRTTDISKRPNNIKGEESYAKFCHEAKKIAGIGSQDAMRKNLFVDFHRMGFIERYDKNKDSINVFERRSVKYVSLTKQGEKLLEGSVLDKYFIFSKGVDKLLGGVINVLLELLRNPEYCIKQIDFYEFMFFVSAVGISTSFKITIKECIDFLKQYRLLTRTQKQNVIERLKSNLKPENYKGNKKNKRDFHNWSNKTEQTFNLLGQTVYFERRKNLLILRDKISGENGDVMKKQLKRSLCAKKEYFKNHLVEEKSKGFEVHHVVPLSWAETIYQFKIFDDWKNMVYIHAYSHAIITQNKNKNIFMDFYGDNIVLKDIEGMAVDLVLNKNIIYNVNLKNLMLSYNNKLNKTVL